VHDQEEKGCGSGEQLERITAGAAADLLLCVAPVASPLPSSRRRTPLLGQKRKEAADGNREGGAEEGREGSGIWTQTAVHADRRHD